ncbi:MAG: YbfB/YjiJ family MFS transporter [Deltaproteobacteria bacterium]|nr:YbfB/YjiJ family MFS transporter [Deltaproteobacteria bacterium]
MKSVNSRIHYGWVILFTGFIGVMGALGFGRFAYTPILPSMKEALSLTYAQMGWIGTGNFIGYMIFAFLGGYLATRFGPRRVISASLVLVAVSLILTGLADSFEFALAMRTLTGAGSAGSNVPIMALASAWFVSRRRGMATGILVSGSSIALLMLGPLIPKILESFPGSGWRVCWYTLGGITLLIALLNYWLIRNRPEEKNLRPVGESSVFPPSADSFPGRSLYTSRSLWHLAGVFFTFGFSYIIYMQFFSAYLINEAKISTEKAGEYLMLLGVLSIFCGPFWGTVSDFIGRKYGLALVLLTQGTSYLIFGLVKSSNGYLASAILFGLTAWSVPSIIAAAVGDTVGARRAPAALGFCILIFSIGQALAPPVAGKIADLTGSFTPAFLLSAVVAFTGMTAALLIRQSSSKS